MIVGVSIFALPGGVIGAGLALKVSYIITINRLTATLLIIR